MELPTIFELLDRLAFLRGMPSVIILLGAAFVAVAATDMRLSVGALLVHTLMAGLLFVDVLDPRLAVVYTLAGLFVAAILLVTAWQVNWGRPPSGLTADEARRLGFGRSRSLGPLSFTNRQLVRLIAAVAALGVAVWMTRGSGVVQTTIPEGVSYLTPAIIGLIGLGLAGLAASAEPLPSGVGLLVFLTGFALFFGFLDQSRAMTVALVSLQFVVALAVGYLAQARYLPVDITG